MDDLVAYVRRVVDICYSRLRAWLSTASPGTIQVTGVIGLALVIILFQVRGRNNRPDDGRRRTEAQRRAADASRQQPQQQQPQHPTASGSSGSAWHAAAAAPQAPAPAADTPQARAVLSQLEGIRRVTISLPGILLRESQPHQLQDGATVVPAAASLVKDVAKAGCDVFLLAHVPDDVAQAAVTGAVEAAGLLGPQRGQIRPQRLLFCATLEGKVSMVRQLEPELHLDAHASTIEDLKRFMPQLVHVSPSGPTIKAPNVGHAPSLAAFFGL